MPGIDYAGPSGTAYHARRTLPKEAERWLANVRAAKLQPHIRCSDVVFEYGVGFGWNLASLQCAQKVGFDVAPGLRLEVEARGIQFVDELKCVASDTFDVVVCHHTLEHLINPAEALAIILRLLKPGGSLLLFAPYEIERKYRRYDRQDHAHHLYSWTPASLANLLINQGFQIGDAGLRRFRFDRVAAMVAFRLRVGELGYRIIRGVGQFVLPEYEIAVVARRI